MADGTDEKSAHLRVVGKATQFPKGKSGNPGGRPKKAFSMTALVMAELERMENAPREKALTNGEAIAANIVKMATFPSVKTFPYCKMVWEYADGLPKDAVRKTMDELAADLATQMGDVSAEEILREYERMTGTGD